MRHRFPATPHQLAEAFHESGHHLSPALSPNKIGGEGVWRCRQFARQLHEPSSVHGPNAHTILEAAAQHEPVCLTPTYLEFGYLIGRTCYASGNQ